jgi:hypothetical protein
LREDLATSTTAAVAAFNAGLISLPEARVLMGLPPTAQGAVGTGADMADQGTGDEPPPPSDVEDGEVTQGEPT